MKPHRPDHDRDIRRYGERDPASAARGEAKARRGRGSRGTRASVDELVAKSRTVADRVGPLIDRVVARVRARLRRK
jgi:hypothetical protein